jgi:hypothetical protein
MAENILPIQFVGTQRSGSNLLRVMLNQLPEICAPHPPHILKTFFPLLPYYGNLNDQSNFDVLVSDVCDWVNHNPVPWENFHLDPVDISNRCETRSLIDLFCKIYEKKAIQDGARFWCCKSMESIYYAREIESSGISPFYIYLYRDGRDTALSFRKAIVGPKHIYSLATKWKQEQQLSLDLLSTLPADRYIVVRYEDLISSPRTVISAICAKLEIPFSERVFDYFKSEESRNTAKAGFMWRNLVMPIIGNNFNKYEHELSEEELFLFESVAGNMLNRLDYHTAYWPNIPEAEFTVQQIQEFDRQDKWLKAEAIKKADWNELNRRKPQEAILTRIKSRNRSMV